MTERTFLDTNVLIYADDVDAGSKTVEGVGCGVLLTEDLNDGQVIEGVRVENPFE